jgi:hypothetical protein
MSIIIKYILIGGIFTFLQDSTIKKMGTDEFTNLERIVLILIWPIGLTLSIYYFIRTFFR